MNVSRSRPFEKMTMLVRNGGAVLGLLLLVGMAAPSAQAVPRGGPSYQTDSGTVGFLRRYLVAGGDITYPLEAVKKKLSGSGFFLMRLRADGTVESVAIADSNLDRSLNEHVQRTLRGYRFKPKTKEPLLWLVSFDARQVAVIIKVQRVKEEDLPIRLPKSFLR